MVSPAAAASVSRALSNAGLRRAAEIRKGIETTGFVAEPLGDHVRVEYVIAYWDDSNDRATGLKACEEALKSNYEVWRYTDRVAEPGVWVEREVLAVRSERWEAR